MCQIANSRRQCLLADSFTTDTCMCNTLFGMCSTRGGRLGYTQHPTLSQKSSVYSLYRVWRLESHASTRYTIEETHDYRALATQLKRQMTIEVTCAKVLHVPKLMARSARCICASLSNGPKLERFSRASSCTHMSRNSLHMCACVCICLYIYIHVYIM